MKTQLPNLIVSRRSVFPGQYNNQPISEAEIKTLLEAANWAPTHRRTEPWRFKVVQGAAKDSLGVFLAKSYKDTIAKFSVMKHKKISEKIEQSAVVIAICMQRDPLERVPEWEEIAAVAMAVQNMWLTAHELKIGAYWSSPSLISEMHNFFDFRDGERCLGFFYLGKYDGELDPGTRLTPIEVKTEWLT
ncbi:MAG: nitroreductase [Planctomycetota bacterium]|jgi:nitroreductase|uniref:nitroreductase family protein n=1 Tax=Patiriisocius sp. Uisw_047 TaxID=3230969 RepID=UPI0039ECFD43